VPKTLAPCALRHILLATVCLPIAAMAQHSVAREWNEALLQAIRTDFARPTVHARNLFYSSIAMYDAWAAYDEVASTFLRGREVGGFRCVFEGVDPPADRQAAREEALSHAVYRLLTHRFADSPGAGEALPRVNGVFDKLGYDATNTSTDYTSGSPAALGNYLAQCLIEFGFQDGSLNLVRYHGVLAPHAADRSRIVPGPATTADVAEDCSGHAHTGDGPSRRHRLS
jgi:hypothetical protein